MTTRYLPLLLLACACGDPTTVGETKAAPELAEYPCIARSREYQPQREPFFTIDERFADVALRTPGGFAGITHRNIVYLKDLTLSEEATPILAREFGETSFRYRQATYDWLELISCYRTLERGGIWQAGVIGSDIQESENRLIYEVQDLAAEEPVVRALIRDLRVPQEMVIIREGEIVTFD